MKLQKGISCTTMFVTDRWVGHFLGKTASSIYVMRGCESKVECQMILWTADDDNHNRRDVDQRSCYLLTYILYTVYWPILSIDGRLSRARTNWHKYFLQRQSWCAGTCGQGKWTTVKLHPVHHMTLILNRNKVNWEANMASSFYQAGIYTSWWGHSVA